jgi:hypothetical protein
MATLNAVVERGCTMLVHFDKGVSASEIKEALETGGEHEKADALKKAIAILLSGEQMPQLFITVIRYVLTTDSKLVQKLLLLYIEIIEKTDSAGKLLPEMILICQNLRNNLQHPNEFLRGSTRLPFRATKPKPQGHEIAVADDGAIDWIEGRSGKKCVARAARASPPSRRVVVPEVPNAFVRRVDAFTFRRSSRRSARLPALPRAQEKTTVDREPRPAPDGNVLRHRHRRRRRGDERFAE